MIIATDDFDLAKVVALRDDYEGLCSYIRSLVPDRYKHIDAIYHNTRYYINMCLLKCNDISLDNKVQISKYLTKNIRVVGYTDIYITCGELESRVNMSRVNKYHEGDVK